MTVFLLQIIRPDGEIVRMPGGGALERDLIEACVQALPYVGLLRTHASVEQAVRGAITEAIMALKRDTRAVVDLPS